MVVKHTKKSNTKCQIIINISYITPIKKSVTLCVGNQLGHFILNCAGQAENLHAFVLLLNSE